MFLSERHFHNSQIKTPTQSQMSKEGVGEADYAGRRGVSLDFPPSAKSRLTLVHLPLVKGFTRPQVKTAFQVGGNVLMTQIPSPIHHQGRCFGSLLARGPVFKIFTQPCASVINFDS